MKKFSIKLNLLKALIGTFTIITIITIIAIFNVIKEETNEIFNYQLKQSATMLANTIDPSAFQNSIGDNDTELGILVFNDTGKPLANLGKKYNISAPPAKNGFKTVTYNNEVLYTYTARSRHFDIVSIQSASARDEFVIYGSLIAIAPLVLFSFIFGFIMWYLLSKGLSPLEKFGQKISNFDLQNINPLQTENLPIELIPLAENMNKMAIKLKQNIKQQKSFIEDAAHELRTPLAALNIQLDLLKKSSDPKELQKNIQLLSHGINRSNRLVEQLLTITRLEYKKDDLSSLQILNLSKILSDVVLDLYIKAESKNISFDVKKEDIFIKAVETDIYVVYKNIIDNAINYSLENSKIIINLYKKNDTGFFETIDFGSGIVDINKKRVFDRFFRVSNHKTIGSGLGLSIVKEICKKYQFDIKLKDNEPMGLKFILSFKLQETIKN